MLSQEKEKWNKYGQERLVSRNILLLPHHRLVMRYFLNFFKNLDINLKVLDIGCGEGFYMELLRDLGFKNITGIDPSLSMIKKAKEKGLNIEIKDVYGLDNKNKYDAVLLMDVLEHLEKPEEALKNIYEILILGGILYLNTYICDSLSLRGWRMVSSETRLKLSKSSDETHVNAHSKREIVSLLKKERFRVVKAQRLSNRFPFVTKISLRLSQFLQQFTIFGLFGDELTVIAKKEP